MPTTAAPHIVLITMDHLRADLLGCAGHPAIQTPHIDFLARRGVRFVNATSTTPMCIPARAMMMTGKDAHSLGVTYNRAYEITDRDTLPHVLREAGYQTRLVGKMHTYPERKHNGFDDMLLCEEGRRLKRGSGSYDDYEDWLAEQGFAGQAWAHGMGQNELRMSPWHLPDYTHATEWIGRETCKQIKRRDWTRPQFLWASFTAPHPPLVPLMRDLYLYDDQPMPTPAVGDWVNDSPLAHQYNIARFAGDRMTERQRELVYRAFYASITQVDRQIGFILGTLREQGMLGSTWVIFTSDHGDNMGDHHLWAKANLLRGSANIPLIVAPPKDDAQLDALFGEQWKPGVTSEALATLQDLLPTCAQIAGLDAPAGIDGQSLLPAVEDPAASVRDVVLGEIGPGPEYSGIHGRSLMLTDGRQKYIWYESDGYELLFDLATDPHECHNLRDAQPKLLRAWRRRLIEMLEQRGDDPAVRDGDLNPPTYERQTIPDVQRARMAADQTLGGLH